MYPDLFNIGPLTIHTYGVFYALGILAAISLAEYLHQRNGGKPGTFQDMGFLVVIGILAGARALFILVNLGYFLEKPLDIFKIWNGGLVFYGGLIGGSLAFILAARLKRLDLWPLADTVAPAVAFGHAIGRLGCFFAGSCYGRPTDVPWAVTFTDPRSLATGVLGVPVHPTQLYESALLLLLTVVLLKIRSHARFPGQVITSYGVMYGAIRFGLEFLRGDPRGSVEILGATISTSQAISLLIVPLCLAGYVYLADRKELESEIQSRVPSPHTHPAGTLKDVISCTEEGIEYTKNR